MARLVLTPYGRPALEALAAVVAEAQGDDPLAPVTVVVPSAPASVSVRRALGRHAGNGLANVRTLALPQLAELLAGPAAASSGRKPLTPTWTAATIRAGLSEALDPLSRVPPSAAVEEALTITFARLREASDAELRALEKRSARAAAVIDRYRDHRERLAGHLDRHDVLLLAAAAVREGGAPLEEIGTVVLHLPRRLGRADLDLVTALAGRTAVTALLGRTGDEDGDRPLRRLLDQLEPLLGEASAVDAPIPSSVARVVLAPDPEEEAREAVRAVLHRLEQGPVDLDRVAIVSRVESPYRLLLHEHLARAGLSHHVDLPWSVAQSMPGRVLLGLLDLPEHGFRRVDVARWLRAGPIRWRGRPVPVPEWDAVARRAGVVQGLDQWQDRLDNRRVELADQVAEGWLEAEAAAQRVEPVDDLQAFVVELGGRLAPGERRSWSDWAAWAREALEHYLEASATAAGWPDDEDRADLDRVHARLDALAELDGVDAEPDAHGLRRVLAEELGRLRRRVGRLGRGVQVGDLEGVYGLDLDLVVVVGMAEGWYPPRHRDDPLLPDHELTDAGLADALGRPDRADERRDHLAALAAGTEVVLLAPRSDPRGQRELQPARWLLEGLAARTGRPVAVGDVADLRESWLRRSPSFEDTVRSLDVALDRTERDLSALLRSTTPGSPAVHAHPVARADARLTRGLDAVADRRDRAYGEWTGEVGPREELVFRDESTASATRLERYALCPFQYLLGNVLGVRSHDDPVDAEGITPRDRGSLVHEVLEEFFRDALERDPDEAWDDDDRLRLHEVLGRVGESYRARGLTGRDLGWSLQSSAMQRWLGAVLDRDADERAARQVTPVAVELRFGDDSEHPPAEVGLPDGRRLLFRGAVDRIDRGEDGSLVVIDYKTGKGASYSRVDKDRLDRGRKLQLPLYADAARRAFDAPDADIEAYYWFVEDSGKKAWRGGPVDEAVQERFEDVVATLVDGIEAGTFPANPGEEGYFGPSNCSYCDYQRVCPSSRVDLWEGVRRDPDLDRYRGLAEGELPS